MVTYRQAGRKHRVTWREKRREEKKKRERALAER
jgi:hypothetical protein